MNASSLTGPWDEREICGIRKDMRCCREIYLARFAGFRDATTCLGRPGRRAVSVREDIGSDCLLVPFDLLLSFVEENTERKRKRERERENQGGGEGVICAGSMGDFFHRRLLGSGIRF